MKYTNILTKSIFMSIDQSWQNVFHMNKRERKVFITAVVKLKFNNAAFVDYCAKYYLACLIDSSECYFNGLGYSTPVKEFKRLGWYTKVSEMPNGKPIYALDFNKVMGK